LYGQAAMTVSVRTVRPGDGDGIALAWLSAASYYTDLDPEHFQVPTEKGLAELFENGIRYGNDDVLQLVAELEGSIVGWLSARVEPSEENAAAQLTREHGWTRLVVDALIVGREHWRQGSGTALLQAAESWGRDRGAEIVRLDTYAQSPVSVPFYEQRMGYTRRSIVFQKRLRPSDP
jgi:GNAT superfamily N-acetyltransferase